MSRACRETVRKTNFALSSVKNKVRIYEEVCMLNNKSMRTPLKNLMHSSAPGKKVSKIGLTLFWIPEPTMISSLVGLPMIAGGKLLDRYYTGTTIRHVNEEARRTLRTLQSFLNNE